MQKTRLFDRLGCHLIRAVRIISDQTTFAAISITLIKLLRHLHGARRLKPSLRSGGCNVEV